MESAICAIALWDVELDSGGCIYCYYKENCLCPKSFFEIKVLIRLRSINPFLTSVKQWIQFITYKMLTRKYFISFGLVIIFFVTYIRASGGDDEKAKKGPKVTDKVRKTTYYL